VVAHVPIPAAYFYDVEAHADHSVTGGKLVYLQEENPSSWGRKNPMSNLSRMKNPDLPCPHVAAALRAYSYVLPP